MTQTKTWRDVLPKIFQSCVAERESRYAITDPWWYRDWVWATDGRILIRTKYRPEFDIIRGNANAPPVMQVWEGEWEDTPLPRVEFPEDELRLDCSECNGDGYLDCNCPDCEEACHECRECGGQGYFLEPRAIIWDQVALNEKYVRPLYEAGAEIYVQRKNPRKSQVRFTTQCGCEGRLMPTRYEDAVAREGEYIIDARTATKSGGAA